MVEKAAVLQRRPFLFLLRAAVQKGFEHPSVHALSGGGASGDLNARGFHRPFKKVQGFDCAVSASATATRSNLRVRRPRLMLGIRPCR